MKVWKSTALLCVKGGRRTEKPKTVKFLGEPMQWVEIASYLGVTLDTQLICPSHLNQVGKKAKQTLHLIVPFLNR